MTNSITIDEVVYEILDSLEYITLADSFVKNKIGTANGEAKLYVGNDTNQRILDFFGDFNNNNCFFYKKDFEQYLSDAKSEYLDPQQEYRKKQSMPSIFRSVESELNSFPNGLLIFQTQRKSNITPPRIYIQSNSKYYEFIRSTGLPNISYLSILKLRNNSITYYYYRMFIDYNPDIVKYTMPEIEKQETIIQNSDLSPKKKQTLIQARTGQGKYREKLLQECSYCPFTFVNDERLLVASHIKPWVKSDYNEKVDPKNGFMFTPTYDKLFDKGFISFKQDGSLLVSPWLSPMNQKRLNIKNGKQILTSQLDTKKLIYLEYHRKHIFKE